MKTGVFIDFDGTIVFNEDFIDQSNMSKNDFKCVYEAEDWNNPSIIYRAFTHKETLQRLYDLNYNSDILLSFVTSRTKKQYEKLVFAQPNHVNYLCNAHGLINNASQDFLTLTDELIDINDTGSFSYQKYFTLKESLKSNKLISNFKLMESDNHSFLYLVLLNNNISEKKLQEFKFFVEQVSCALGFTFYDEKGIFYILDKNFDKEIGVNYLMRKYNIQYSYGLGNSLMDKSYCELCDEFLLYTQFSPYTLRTQVEQTNTLLNEIVVNNKC